MSEMGEVDGLLILAAALLVATVFSVARNTLAKYRRQALQRIAVAEASLSATTLPTAALRVGAQHRSVSRPGVVAAAHDYGTTQQRAA